MTIDTGKAAINLESQMNTIQNPNSKIQNHRLLPIVCIGGSAGAIQALEPILKTIPPSFLAPVFIIQHLHVSDDGSYREHLERIAHIPVVEPIDKMKYESGCIYTAPANYHMLIEKDGTIGLSVDQKVNWSRPSIDVLFESAAYAKGRSVIAVILSGANSDGAMGIHAIKAAGGKTIAQDPEESESPIMPRAAIDTGAIDEILTLDELGDRIVEITKWLSSEINSTARSCREDM